MIERNPVLSLIAHALLLLGVASICFPLYYAFVGATLPIADVLQVPMPLWPGDRLGENVAAAWDRGAFGRQLVNSAIMATVIAAGKIAISLLSAFAITYFRFPFRVAAFWAIFVTLMLPIEVRIVPTYEVAANALAPLAWLAEASGLDALLGGRLVARLEWSLLDSYVGLTLPLIASATATFLFRQFFLTVPDDLAEAAKIDGAGPLRFFRDVLLPLSTTNVAALAVILFVFGWNQYLWPLLITTDPSMTTVVVGVARLIPGPEPQPAWNVAMAGGLIALAPPVLVVLLLQHWFVKGLVDTEK
ncbi:MAG: ABC transporter permease subunit [Alphaproteobacteria bacterium]|nr:ABC transporter permease subunit [Alphaproteobacteria bacterium]